jgi:hypothetical protein
MRFVGSMSSDFDRAEAQRQKEIDVRLAKYERALKKAQSRQSGGANLFHWFIFLTLVGAIAYTVTHRIELQQFASVKFNQYQARNQSGNQGNLRQSAINHEAEINQASQ